MLLIIYKSYPNLEVTIAQEKIDKGKQDITARLNAAKASVANSIALQPMKAKALLNELKGRFKPGCTLGESMDSKISSKPPHGFSTTTFCSPYPDLVQGRPKLQLSLLQLSGRDARSEGVKSCRD